MSKFSLRTTDIEELIIQRIIDDRGIGSKAKAISWLINSYDDFCKAGQEITSLKWKHSLAVDKLEKLKTAVKKRQEIEETIESLCRENI